MDINQGKENKIKLKLINALIIKFHQFFVEQAENIQFFSSNFENLNTIFDKKYKLYINIERFAIPVIGRISAGKSTFLSYLLGLKDIKGDEEIATTQIICIIRHNKNCEKPKVYNVIFEERNLKDFQNNNEMIKYNFNKDESNELTKGTESIKTIIKNKNNYIKNSKKEKLTKDDFFLIIEMNIPIFNGELEKYSEIFEFMDLPGLNDTDEIQVFFKENILPIIIPNIIFSFFIFDSSKFYVNDTFDVYDYFLKKLNGIDNEIKFENYYNEIVLGKENNFYVLNKIDIEHKSTIKDDLIKKFKIDEKKNFIQETNSKLLINETEKNKNFNSYLDIKIDNSKQKDFTRYIQKEIRQDFNLKSLDLKKEITINENEKNEISKYLKEKETVLKRKNYTNLLKIDTYYKLREIYETHKKNINVNKENMFYHKLLEACENSFNSFCDLQNYEKEYNDLMKKISKGEDNNILSKTIKSLDISMIKSKRELIKDYIIQLENLEDNNIIRFIHEEYDKLYDFIDNDNKIRLAFLGTTSTGKSTLLNNIIGKKILPTGAGICTKKGIIIQNINNNIPELYEAKFESKNGYYIFKQKNESICKGYEEVKKKLEEINNSNEKVSFEDIFCILKIKIELLDYLELDDKIKNKIELIDFPGFETNTVNENELFGPLIDIISGFIFINKDDSIKESSNERILSQILNKIKSRKYNIDLGKSCLFILNNFSNSQLNIKQSKDKIQQIIKNKIINNGDFLRLDKKNEQINVIEINGRIFENFIELKNILIDFNKFIVMNINKLKEYDDDINEENIKEYIEENYYNNFDNPSLENKELEDLNLYNILCEKLKINSEECFSRKDELYNICKEYEWMSKNIFKHNYFKSSHADELFKYLKTIFENIKRLINQISENSITSFINQFNRAFRVMDKKYKGNLLSKEFEKEKVKNNIELTYKEYLNTIINTIEKNYKQYNIEIDNYLIRIDSDEKFDLIKEGNNIVNNINEKWKKVIKIVEDDFTNYKKKLKEIGREIIQLLEDDNIDDNSKVIYDDSVLLNFISSSHLALHLAFIVPSVLLSLMSGVGIVLGIGIHSIIATTNLIIDLNKKKETLKKHMIDFKFNLGSYYIEFKDKVIKSLYTLKMTLENDIEKIVVLNNKKFDERNKEKFVSIYKDFKKVILNK